MDTHLKNAVRFKLNKKNISKYWPCVDEEENHLTALHCGMSSPRSCVHGDVTDNNYQGTTFSREIPEIQRFGFQLAYYFHFFAL